MKAPRLALMGIVGVGLLAAPLVAMAQPALENFRGPTGPVGREGRIAATGRRARAAAGR
jgi:hypothetical protein